MRGRLSDVGHLLLPAIQSRSQLKKAIKRGEIWVNGEVGTTGRLVSEEDELTYLPAVSKASTLELDIVVHYEDDHIAIVEKPAGLPVSGNRHRQLDNCLAYNLAASTQVDSLPRPLPSHRLDKATTGLLLCSKTRRAHIKLHQMLASRQVIKTYEAVVIGLIYGSGSFVHPINGKAALTDYNTLHIYPSDHYGHLTHLRLDLHTGRTHQIRKHCAGAGLPIMGDRLYCPPTLLRSRGLRLQATDLALDHPISGDRVEVEIPFKYAIAASTV
jgi:RluA family pseudouridine synthase